MATRNPIVAWAVTGSALSPSMSPCLPIAAEAMINQSPEATAAGTAILHFHGRDPAGGLPSNDVAIWRGFRPGIRVRCDAIINMSRCMGATAEERASAALELRPEIATVIVGSMKYGRFKKAQDQGTSDFRHQ